MANPKIADAAHTTDLRTKESALATAAAAYQRIVSGKDAGLMKTAIIDDNDLSHTDNIRILSGPVDFDNLVRGIKIAGKLPDEMAKDPEQALKTLSKCRKDFEGMVKKFNQLVAEEEKIPAFGITKIIDKPRIISEQELKEAVHGVKATDAGKAKAGSPVKQ